MDDEVKMPLQWAGYYNKPEGSDFYGKMKATNSFALAAGFAWSTFDVLMYSRTKGYLPTLARVAYNVGPMMGMASAFTIATYALTNARGKDDRLNYFLGGIAAGGVYGAWKRNHITGIFMGIFFGIAGIVKKTSIQEGWEFFPPLNHRAHMGIKAIDLTLIAERPKNYTTGEKE